MILWSFWETKKSPECQTVFWPDGEMREFGDRKTSQSRLGKTLTRLTYRIWARIM